MVGYWLSIVLVAFSMAATSLHAQPTRLRVAAADDPKTQTLKRFAAELSTAIQEQDAARFDALLNLDAMLDTAMRNVPADAEVADGFRTGFIDGARKGSSLGAQIVASADAHSSYTFLRLIPDSTKPGEMTLLFRLLGQGGLNYHRIYVQPRGDNGELAVVDMHIAATGEKFSDTIRRLYIPAAVNASKPDSPEARELNRAYEQLQRMGQLRNQGKFAEALAVSNQMPEKFQRQTLIQVLRISCAAQIDDETYSRVLTEAEPLLGEEIVVDMMGIDAHLLRGEYEKSIAAIDRIDKFVGGDPYLDVLRGNIRFTEDRLADAKKLAKAAAAREPTLYHAQDLLLSIALKEKDHPETVRLLRGFEKQFGLRFGDLKDAEGYEDFIKSPHYQKWVATRATD